MIRYLLIGLWLLANHALALELADVMSRMQERQSRFAEWDARMKVDIDLPGMKLKGKKVLVHFQAPDSFRFEAKGFAILPRRTMMWTVDSLFKGLSEVELDYPVTAPPSSPLRVQGLFRDGGLFAHMSYQVDTTRWFVTHVDTRVITQSDTLEALSLVNSWVEVSPDAWLPESVELRMSLREDLQEFYERLRTPLRRRRESREGDGRISMELDRHEWKLRDESAK
jgi:hypothetical protein